MLKKGLYIVVSVWFICLMTGFRVSQPLPATGADTQLSSPFDSHPPRRTAALWAKPSAKEQAKEDAARQTRKARHRAKCTLDHSRYVDIIPLLNSFQLSSLPRIPSINRQHFRTVLTGALPHYYAFLFRLTPF